jgi:hypothetical protein
MLMITQILGYFELIVYIYIVCNRVFIELHDRTAHKSFSFAMHFFAMHLLSPTARKPTIMASIESDILEFRIIENSSKSVAA